MRTISAGNAQLSHILHWLRIDGLCIDMPGHIDHLQTEDLTTFSEQALPHLYHISRTITCCTKWPHIVAKQIVGGLADLLPEL